ncbi:methyltransferase family protein [Rhodobaculum claviforme]|uniref:Protein-S-isoprenylcysteine O-methyltransferase Ste14 n=1 Tax=Rhodobaculum claviforme TaxID=1549854 RepID=A0A934WK60_9RHOB|nr:isoprenylcysteine carboxylmethyltransferase family protein [Rhodobaculum claviforme]MBK5928529.1 hypothetical protein [Rhodobaculum claviforme]
MRWLDYPPVWLLGFLGLAWGQVWLMPGPSMQPTGTWPGWLGGALVLAGLGLMVLATPQFLRLGTTLVPHRAPRALITGGIYRLSRNPIYLADVLLLAGFVLRWEAWVSLLLVPVFMWVVEVRFIRPEEERLHHAFGDDFNAYRARVRRWI